MYRLPSQFDPDARQDDHAAAGGGSTSTTCSSCVVSLGVASLATARIFAGVEPPPLAGDTRQTPAKPAEEPAPAHSETAMTASSPGAIEPVLGPSEPPPDRTTAAPLLPPARPMSRRARLWLGALAPLIALAIAGLGLIIQPMLGTIAACATYIGLFCLIHERAERSPAAGAGKAILILIAFVIGSVLEMMVWMNAL